MPEPEWKPRDPPSRRLEVVLDSNAESAELAASQVVAFSQGAGFDERQCHEIGLAVRESVANAVIHGNGRDAAKKVRLAAELREISLAISIEDEGGGFELDSVHDPLAPGQVLKDSGRGLFLVKACMDEVRVLPTDSGGTALILLKYFHNLPKGKRE